MKRIFLIFSMIVISFINLYSQASQQTYSCLEFVDGEHTGYTIDLTFNWISVDTVIVTRSIRQSSGTDEYAYFNITGDPLINTTEGGYIEFSNDPWYVPFDGDQSEIIVSEDKVSFACECGHSGEPGDCSIPPGGDNITCINGGDCLNWCFLRCYKRNGGLSPGVFLYANHIIVNY